MTDLKLTVPEDGEAFNLIKERESHFGWLVISAIAHTAGDPIDRVKADAAGNLLVKLTVNGAPVSLRAVAGRLADSFDDMVKEAAGKLLDERLGVKLATAMESIDGMAAVVAECKARLRADLGLPAEERW